MALGTCLTDLRARKLISEARYEKLLPIYEGLLPQFERLYGRAAAESMATEKALDAIDFEALTRKKQVLLQAKAQATVLHQARHVYAGGKFAEGPVNRKALRAHLVRDEHANGIASVEMQGRVILDQARRLNYDLLTHFRHNLLGKVRHKADELDLARALAGEDVGSSGASLNLKEMADAARQTNEWLRSRYNAAGGHIGKLEGYDLPHHWDAYRVGQMSPEQYIDFIAPELHPEKMIDFQTGLPLSGEKLAVVLRDVYESTVSEGANAMTPGQSGGRSMANRRAEHRVLHFRDAKAWFRVNEKLGSGGVYTTLLAHWERMAHDTAAMEVLGPNPDATVRWMQDLLGQEAKTRGGLADRAQASVGDYEFELLWKELTGANRRAVRGNVALFGATLRNLQIPIRLGFSVVTAQSDHATRFVTNLFNGMPATQLLKPEYLQQVMPIAGRGRREWARRNLFISDEYAGRMGQLGRMHLEDAYGGRLLPDKWNLRGGMQSAHEVSRRLADGALRLFLLTPHTVAGREVAAMDFVRTLSFHARDGFASLDADFRAMLERHGIGEAKWEALRATPMTDRNGTGWLLPDMIEDRALREQVLRAQFMEIDRAVPTGGAWQAAVLKGGSRPGTVHGELVRFGVQFKLFPTTVIAQHGTRMMAIPTLRGRAKYAASFLAATTLMGMWSVQLYELLHGRDPLPIDGDLVGKGLLKAGGLGVYGDAIKASRSEFGQSVGELTVGPSATTVQDAASMGWAAGDLGAAAAFGDDADVADARLGAARAGRNLLRRETPLTNSFYTHLAYERLLVDTLFEISAGDPDAVRRSYGATHRYAQEQGTAYYWGPGSPMRAPDFGNAVGSPTAPENVASE